MYCKNLRLRTKQKRKYLYCTRRQEEIKHEFCGYCQYKEYKKVDYSHRLRTKTKKLAKLERNRKSVFTNDLEHCYLCGNKKDDLHEIFSGRNRINSIKYGFILPLCRKCHSENQNKADFNDFWHRQAQLYFETQIGSRNDFLEVFRKNFIE